MTEQEWDWRYKMLVELRIATVRNDKYVYSRDFEDSIAHLNNNPPGRIESVRLAAKVKRDIVPLLLQQAKIFKSRKEIENTVIAYIGLKVHCKRLGLDFPTKDDLIGIVWAIYWLNDHEPSISEEEE